MVVDSVMCHPVRLDFIDSLRQNLLQNPVFLVPSQLGNEPIDLLFSVKRKHTFFKDLLVSSPEAYNRGLKGE